MKYLYHLTKRKNLKDILTHGLKAQIGKNAKLCDESPHIWLCTKENICRWMILLDTDACVRVDIRGLKLEERSFLSEYMCEQNIAPERIKKAHVSITAKERTKVMKDLCESYIYSISFLVRTTAEYYKTKGFRHEPYPADSLKSIYISTLYALNKLDYSVLSNKKKKEIILENGDGYCAFTDCYYDTEQRLWEQLVLYPKDELYGVRMKLHEYITKNFPKQLYLDTGGWGY